MGQAAERGVRARRSIAAIAVGLLVLQSTAQAQTPNPAADLNRNGIVDMDDFIAVGDCVSATIMDLPVPPECGQMQDPHPAGGGDGDWDLDDYLEVQSNFGEVFDVGDDTPPTIAITEPADGALLDAPSVHVRGTVDDLNLKIELEVSNAAGTRRVRGSPGGSSMDFNVRQVPLQPGGNLLTVRATDLAGNVGSHSIEVTYQPPDRVPPEIGISRPAAGAVLTESPIAVSGTINEPAATVRVNGVAATVADGMFTANEIVLAPGFNTIKVTATDPSGNRSAQSVEVTYAPDLTAPVVSIRSPLTGSVLNASPVDVSGTVDDAAATVVVNGVHAPVNAGAFTAVGVALNEGLNTVRVTATDPAGNQGSDEIQVTYQSDATPPVVQILSPADGAVLAQSPIAITGTVDEPSATVRLNGTELTVSDGNFTAADILLSIGTNTFEITATDPAGNTGSAEIQVTYAPDLTAPVVQITSPADGAVVEASPIAITGTVDDSTSTVRLNGIDLTVSNGTFTASDITLTIGPNTFEITATDPAGNTGSAEIQVTYTPDLTAPVVQITSPSNGAVLDTSPIAITGTVDDPTATVRLNGTELTVSDGTFTATDIALSIGANTFEVTATDPAGNVASSGIEITYQPEDVNAPVVVIALPHAGATVADASIQVSGTVDDAGAVVTVNGVTATVEQGSFTAVGIALAEGPNQITASATDAAGNSAQTSVSVTYVPPDTAPPTLTVDGGTADRFTDQADIVLDGSVQDDGGVASLRVHTQAFGGADFAATIDAGRWTATVPLAVGENPLKVHATDRAGNESIADLRVHRQVAAAPLRIDLSYPAHGALLSSDTLVARGSLHVDTRALELTLSVNGVAATLADTDQATVKTFTTPPLALGEGINTLLLVAGADGQMVQDLVQVTYQPPQIELPPPVIRILAPLPDSVLAQRTFTLVGEVISAAGLVDLRIDGQALPLHGAAPGPYHFGEPFAFAAGAVQRTLSIEARDARERTTRRSVVLYLDQDAPLIQLDRALQPPPAVNDIDQIPYTLSGTVADPRLASFTVAGRALGLTPAAAPGQYSFSTPLTMEAGVAHPVALVATDHAGNRAEATYLLRADGDLRMTLLAPAADLELQIEPQSAAADNAAIDIAVRLEGNLPDALRAVLLDAQGAEQGRIAIGGDGALRGAQLTLPALAGRYRLEVQALDADGGVRARSGRSVELIEAADADLVFLAGEPAAGSSHAEPNAPLTLFFNRAVDPALITVGVHESIVGQTYVDQDPPGTAPIHAKGYRLAPVTRSHAPVGGALSLLPGGRTVVFYPERELAYGSEVFVDISHDGAALGHFNYRTRALPTLLTGSVQDVFGQGVAGVQVRLPEQGRQTTTDRTGGFALGFGDAPQRPLRGGRTLLDINPGLTLAGYGSRRQWITLQTGRNTALGPLRLAPLNPDVPAVPATGGGPLSLLNGALVLDLTEARLAFPDGRAEGDLHAQFLSFSQLPYPGTDLAVPHFVYALHPAGVEPHGAIGLELQVPALNQGFEHLPPEGTYVLLVGLDPKVARLVPVGVGQLDGRRVQSRGPVALPVLDLIGYALGAPWQQDAFAAYAQGASSLPRLLATLRAGAPAQGEGTE